MLEQISKPELIYGVLIVIGGAGMAAKKLGWIHFGSVGKDGCPDPACHESLEVRMAQIGEVKSDVARIEKTINEGVFPTINATAKELSRIGGLIDGMVRGGTNGQATR